MFATDIWTNQKESPFLTGLPAVHNLSKRTTRRSLTTDNCTFNLPPTPHDRRHQNPTTAPSAFRSLSSTKTRTTRVPSKNDKPLLSLPHHLKPCTTPHFPVKHLVHHRGNTLPPSARPRGTGGHPHPVWHASNDQETLATHKMAWRATPAFSRRGEDKQVQRIAAPTSPFVGQTTSCTRQLPMTAGTNTQARITPS